LQINKQITEKDSLKCHLSKCIYKVICFKDIPEPGNLIFKETGFGR